MLLCVFSDILGPGRKLALAQRKMITMAEVSTELLPSRVARLALLRERSTKREAWHPLTNSFRTRER